MASFQVDGQVDWGDMEMLDKYINYNYNILNYYIIIIIIYSIYNNNNSNIISIVYISFLKLITPIYSHPDPRNQSWMEPRFPQPQVVPTKGERYYLYNIYFF